MQTLKPNCAGSVELIRIWSNEWNHAFYFFDFYFFFIFPTSWENLSSELYWNNGKTWISLGILFQATIFAFHKVSLHFLCVCVLFCWFSMFKIQLHSGCIIFLMKNSSADIKTVVASERVIYFKMLIISLRFACLKRLSIWAWGMHHESTNRGKRKSKKKKMTKN